MCVHARSRRTDLGLHLWNNINDTETKGLLATDVVEDENEERMTDMGNSEPRYFYCVFARQCLIDLQAI